MPLSMRFSPLWAAAVATLVWPVLATVQSSAAPEVVLSGTAHKALYAVDFDGTSGVAVGERGAILRSADAGKTWTQDKTPTHLALLGTAIQGEHRLIVGQSGTVLSARGAGAWTPVDPGVETRLLAVAMNARGVALAVGQFGTIVQSMDWGASWQPAAPDWIGIFSDGIQPHLYSVDLAEDGTATVGGESGMILRRKLGEATQWRVLRIARANRDEAQDVASDREASIFDLDLREDGIGYAVGQAGLILRTADGGETWTQVESGTGAILLGVVATDQGQVRVSGIREMLASEDGGASWRRVGGAQVTPFWYSGVARADGGQAIVFVGQSGRILRSAVQ